MKSSSDVFCCECGRLIPLADRQPYLSAGRGGRLVVSRRIVCRECKEEARLVKKKLRGGRRPRS